MPENAVQAFASDCNPDAAQQHLAHLRPMAIRALESPQPPSSLAESEFEGCMGAVVLTEDQAMPVNTQEGLLTASGRNWLMQRIACSHSAPFVERCDELAGIVETMTENFEGRLDSMWQQANES